LNTRGVFVLQSIAGYDIVSTNGGASSLGLAVKSERLADTNSSGRANLGMTPGTKIDNWRPSLKYLSVKESLICKTYASVYGKSRDVGDQAFALSRYHRARISVRPISSSGKHSWPNVNTRYSSMSPSIPACCRRMEWAIALTLVFLVEQRIIFFAGWWMGVESPSHFVGRALLTWLRGLIS